MLFVAGLGLFSTRWVLQALGKEDFGLYSVVGGLIVFILFVGTTMASSVNRFYAYAIGKGDCEEVKKWFNCALVLHGAFALLLVLVGFPFGNFLLDHVMQIPPNRLATCHWVYYLSILGGVETMLVTPFLGMYYAKQRIFELSLWGSLVTTFSFLFAWLLLGLEGNLLLIYAVGMVSIKMLFDIIQVIRAHILFKECRFSFAYWPTRERIKQFGSFASWVLFGAAGGVVQNQGLAALINIFSGAKVNAAFGIAYQVTSRTDSITAAVYQSILPEITSREGAGNRERMISLAIRVSRLSFLINLFLLVPLYVEIDYLLELWLTEVPEYSAVFCRIILLAFMIDKLTTGYMGAVWAGGKIAGYQALLGGLNIMTFPLALCVYLLGGSPGQAVSALLLTRMVSCFARIAWVKRLMNVPFSRWFSPIFLRCIATAIPPLLLAYGLEEILPSSFLRLLILSAATALCTGISCWFFGFDSEDREFVRKKTRNVFTKFRSTLSHPDK